jgi:integrase
VDHLENLPEHVRAAVAAGTRSVLIDRAALAAVRDRFDDEQAASLGRYLAQSQSANTVRAYRADWVAWAAWCAAESRQALPADPLDVAVYLAAAADTRRDERRWAFGPSTLERKAAAIAAVHAANGLPSPTRADVVRLTLRGIRRARRARPVRKRPVLLDTLEALLAELPPPAFPGGVARRRDRALLLFGFAGALRRAELAAIRLDDVACEADPRSGEPMLVIELGITKTDPTGAARHRVVLPRGRRRLTCPVCAFADWADLLAAHRAGLAAGVADWLDRHGADDSDAHRCHTYRHDAQARGPLFPAVSRHGRIGARSMSDRAVADVVKRYAAKAGFDPRGYSGHSLRAGFATQAALGGAADREIMRQGRWTNAATVHRYIRSANPLDDNAVTRLGL